MDRYCYERIDEEYRLPQLCIERGAADCELRAENFLIDASVVCDRPLRRERRIAIVESAIATKTFITRRRTKTVARVCTQLGSRPKEIGDRAIPCVGSGRSKDGSVLVRRRVAIEFRDLQVEELRPARSLIAVFRSKTDSILA
jgi:hypothetical protein